MNKINIRELKESINVLLGHLIENGVDCLEIERQFYWVIGDPEKYDMSKVPTEIGVGDLACDLSFVEKILCDKTQVAAYTLTEVAPIIAYLGENASSNFIKKRT
ncbi:hypothetical protein [Burkholderia pseudomallei]|uniref:hypothetical protein n=1 Tax=Burkholderia pseudomallei TaxID=28450 RepID=UPI0022EB742F|nr:hypothetical protein [Burkholderia pseudomallei]